MEFFSIILIKNRQRLNLSQEEAAIQVGVSQSTYQEWEKGRSPKLKYLPKLKALFGLSSIDEFFEEPSNITPPRNSAFVINFSTKKSTCHGVPLALYILSMNDVVIINVPEN